MKPFITLICCLFVQVQAFAQADTLQRVITGRYNSASQQEKPYVILISADGFRYDYADKYQAKKLIALREQGVQAESMLPAFPSKTFPNHYSIVTGLYPASHGLINNYFYDPKRQEYYTVRDRSKVEDGSWYGGTPLWVLAEQQQMLSASFFWVGSEAPIQGVLPTYHYQYSEVIPVESRIKTVVDWLNLPEERRPHLITIYLPAVDHAGHRYGPEAPETRQAVLELDEQIRQLTEAVATTGLPVNYVFLSDHGMLHIDTENTLSLPAAIDTSKFIVSSGDVMVELHAKDKSAIRSTYKQLKKDAEDYKVYRKRNMPRYLHYGRKDDKYCRIGDILLLADAPKVFHFSARKPSPGTHGYDATEVKEMHATFYAWGPAFRKGRKIPSFESVDVYPVIAEILGLRYGHKIDGSRKLVKEVL
ncbi:alkaline phosphatase family protein [Pontibacter sp. JH31]|uniref:Alkaline phosphatase family protein n=1 Tax=Pontibacter aquaedesilientis TaxID=2766980 RepID=A0ABR7XD44_9BACT|nr:ectonucleotide pyrophosphatase/phosphodiesterase [Pontibacter aquaedesilientis]MBD1396218.1 alkaline phosphatase family protein [Pontibacter aquaedesilientis]